MLFTLTHLMARSIRLTAIIPEQKANVLGLAKEAVASADQQFTIVARGPISGLTGLSVGLDYFLENDGNITTTAPSGGGVSRLTLDKQ